MGVIADRIRQMRGCTFNEIIAEIEAMEDAALNVGSSDFDAFWRIWPHKVGKPVAKKAYLSARKRGNTHAQIVSGATRYVRTKPADRPWLNPSTFLNQERFNDQPAEAAPALIEPKGGDVFFAAAEFLRNEPTGHGAGVTGDWGHDESLPLVISDNSRNR